MTLFVCVCVRACDCFFNPLMEMRTKYLAKIICYTHIYFIKVDDYREELISRTNSGHLLYTTRWASQIFLFCFNSYTFYQGFCVRVWIIFLAALRGSSKDACDLFVSLCTSDNNVFVLEGKKKKKESILIGVRPLYFKT